MTGVPKSFPKVQVPSPTDRNPAATPPEFLGKPLAELRFGRGGGMATTPAMVPEAPVEFERLDGTLTDAVRAAALRSQSRQGVAQAVVQARDGALYAADLLGASTDYFDRQTGVTRRVFIDGDVAWGNGNNGIAVRPLDQSLQAIVGSEGLYNFSGAPVERFTLPPDPKRPSLATLTGLRTSDGSERPVLSPVVPNGEPETGIATRDAAMKAAIDMAHKGAPVMVLEEPGGTFALQHVNVFGTRSVDEAQVVDPDSAKVHGDVDAAVALVSRERVFELDRQARPGAAHVEAVRPSLGRDGYWADQRPALDANGFYRHRPLPLMSPVPGDFVGSTKLTREQRDEAVSLAADRFHGDLMGTITRRDGVELTVKGNDQHRNKAVGPFPTRDEALAEARSLATRHQTHFGPTAYAVVNHGGAYSALPVGGNGPDPNGWYGDLYWHDIDKSIRQATRLHPGVEALVGAGREFDFARAGSDFVRHDSWWNPFD